MVFNSLILTLLLTACLSSTPPANISATKNVEFTLTPGQTAVATDTGLSLRLISIAGDERCPLNIECAASGPVSLSISIQKDSMAAVEFALQTFTDNDGRSPDFEFEGIQDRIEFEGYLIQVKGVLPYPLNLDDRINLKDYQVGFVISEK